MEPQTEQWAIVEVFGHERYVGMVSTYSMGGENFIRLDVPEIGDIGAFTKLFGKGAVYSITFLEEDAGRTLAAALKRRPIVEWKFLDYDASRLLTLPEEARQKILKLADEIGGESQLE